MFEEKNVSDGYALNFLIPKKLALLADRAGIVKTKQLQEQIASKRALEQEKLEEKKNKRLEKTLELEKFRQAKRA